MGYHLQPIAKGTLGQASKIQEELDELLDAERQNNKILAMGFALYRGAAFKVGWADQKSHARKVAGQDRKSRLVPVWHAGRVQPAVPTSVVSLKGW